MADIANDIATAQRMSKDVYGQVQDLQVEHQKILDRIPFNTRNKLGSAYVEPVWVSEESGVTYEGPGGGVVYDIEEAVAAESVEARGDGAELTVKSTVSFKRLSTAVSNGEEAFVRFFTKLLSNMRKTHVKRGADVVVNGGSPRGVVSAAAGSGATQTFTLSLASCKGVFINSRSKIDIFEGATATKRNLTSTFKIDRFVPGAASHALTVTATGPNAAAEMNAVAANDTIYFKGQRGNEATGLRTIAGQTSGAYLTIDPATVPEWQGNVQAVGANMSLTQLRRGATLAMDRGAMGEFLWLGSHRVFNHFADDVEVLREVKSADDEMNFRGGLKTLKYYLEDEMTISFATSTLFPDTEAVLIPVEDYERIGSSDISFSLVGGPDERMLNIIQGKNGVELRSYSDWLLWSTNIRSSVKYTTITP